MRANCKYLYGEKNHQSKLKDKDREWIINMSKWKEDKINRIDDQIEQLKKERETLKRQYSQNQLALDFGVKPITIRRTLKGDYR